jgi:hypothetical protein
MTPIEHQHLALQQKAAIVKAGYVIVTAFEQSRVNLNILSRIISEHLPEITVKDVESGRSMKMKHMVSALESLNEWNYDGIKDRIEGMLDYMWWNTPTSSKAQLLVEEIQHIVETGNYHKDEMPELALRLKISRFTFN